MFSGHVFLKDKNEIIYDLYWQPMGYSNLEVNQKQYANAISINCLDFWDKYDIPWGQIQKKGLDSCVFCL